MKRIHLNSVKIWNIVLLISVIFASFIMPVLSPNWHMSLFRSVYTLIYISAVLSLDKRPKSLIILVIITIAAEWFSATMDFPIIHIAVRLINILYFLVMVFLLIREIALAKDVNVETIVGSIVGYLLLGITYSFFIAFIIQQDPGAFNIPKSMLPATGNPLDISTPLYFGFVTLATLGYGDIVPLKPYSRSIATWIAVSGQFYIAIIVALLVGKFAARPKMTPEK